MHVVTQNELKVLKDNKPLSRVPVESQALEIA